MSSAPRDPGLSSPHQDIDGTATRGDDKTTPPGRRLRAHLSRRYVEIGVPIPALLLARGRWQIRVEPDCWLVARPHPRLPPPVAVMACPADLKDWTVALLTQAQFDALPEYSCPLPTGTTIGKRWKRREPYEDGPPGTVHTWWMGEYLPDEREGYVGIRWSKIKVMTPRQAQVAEALRKEGDGS